jgi:spore coat protein U-like protein
MGTVAAGDADSNIAVSSTVTASCNVSATPLNVGEYNPIGKNDVDVEGTVTTLCSVGTPFNVGFDAGQGTGATVETRGMTHPNGSEVLNYSLYQDSAHTQVWGETVGKNTVAGVGSTTLSVYGHVPAQQNVPADNYQDSVRVFIVF